MRLRSTMNQMNQLVVLVAVALALLNPSECNIVKRASNYKYLDKRVYRIGYDQNDSPLINQFIGLLKQSNGEWSRFGLQRIIRLYSECSRSYVSIRNLRIKADVPVNEAFRDPYTLIEKQVFRRFSALKSKQTNKYVCFNIYSGNFILKNVNELDASCIFHHSTKSTNRFSFAVGSDHSVFLAFNKLGRLVNQNLALYINQNQCELDRSNKLYIHTKIGDSISPVAPAASSQKKYYYAIGSNVGSNAQAQPMRRHYVPVYKSVPTTTRLITTTTTTLSRKPLTAPTYKLIRNNNQSRFRPRNYNYNQRQMTRQHVIQQQQPHRPLSTLVYQNPYYRYHTNGYNNLFEMEKSRLRQYKLRKRKSNSMSG